MTACEGPGPVTIEIACVQREFFDYVGRGSPYGPDDGTVAPWAVAASRPLAPGITLPVLDYCIHDIRLAGAHGYGFKASFNPVFPDPAGGTHAWASPWHCALNEGPTVLMIENYRSGLPWQLMRGCSHVAADLGRAVVKVGDTIPSVRPLDASAHALARYAALCQEAGIVPVVEPEVLMDGAHSLERTAEVTAATLDHAVLAFRAQGVVLELLLLKPSMVLPGTDAPPSTDVREVAEATVRCLRRSVPAAVPGVVFFSGGQEPELATARLNAMNVGPAAHPWPLGFSFARALQAPAMAIWRGDPRNVAAGQQAFLHRARCIGAARDGLYTPGLERAIDASTASGPAA